MQQTQHFTRVYDDAMTALIAGTAKGQAHWAGTGPSGKTCKECMHYGTDGRCQKVMSLTGRRGAKFADYAKACRFFSN